MKTVFGRWTCAVLLAMLAAGCGGGGGGSAGVGAIAGGTGGTGIASGTVEAIGSVTVNGVTFSCDGAIIQDDDGTLDQGPGDSCVRANASGGLELGMIVAVDGSINANGTTGTATNVRVRPRLRGPITAIDSASNSFTVMGQTVIVDGDTRFKINANRSASLTSLTNGMIVQVAGFVQADGSILATFVQTKNPLGSGQFEIKGVVRIANGVITIGALSVIPGSVTSLVDGQCFELKGSLNANQLTLISAKTDDDCKGFQGSANSVEVEGIVSGFTAASAEFKVGNQRVILGSSLTERGGTVAEDLIDGAKVEVEGAVSGGLMTARKISFKRSVRIQAALDSVDTAAKTATVMGITVRWDSRTRIEDTPQSGQQFEIRGRKSGPAQVTASRIRQTNDGDTELRGAVDASPLPELPNFNILGVQIQTSVGSTDFESIGGRATTQAAFFSELQANDIVKAKGTRSGNAISAREVEFED
jgi:hypothetical protein